MRKKRVPGPFTLLSRAMPNGTAIWYYRARRPDGTRTCAWSTGETERKAAESYCNGLITQNKLIQAPSWGLKKNDPRPSKPLTFGDLAKNFWSWDSSAYIAAKLRFGDPERPPISKRYVDDMAGMLERYIMPTFRRRRLEEITPQEVEAFALRLRDGGLGGKRANGVVSCLRLMLGESFRAGVLPWDPQKKNVVRSLGSTTKRRGRLTLNEVRALFAEDAIQTAWSGHLLFRCVNFVAAATGMRQGEILAVRDGDVRDGFIHVEHSYDHRYGLLPTKNRGVRDVPIPDRVMQAIRPFLGSGNYCFSLRRGERPCSGDRATEALYGALAAIGISPEERKRRNICFHSWRSWLNTTLRAGGVPDDLTRRVTGHSSEEMTTHYTTYSPEDYGPVSVIQREVFEP